MTLNWHAAVRPAPSGWRGHASPIAARAAMAAGEDGRVLMLGSHRPMPGCVSISCGGPLPIASRRELNARIDSRASITAWGMDAAIALAAAGRRPSRTVLLGPPASGLRGRVIPNAARLGELVAVEEQDAIAWRARGFACGIDPSVIPSTPHLRSGPAEREDEPERDDRSEPIHLGFFGDPADTIDARPLAFMLGILRIIHVPVVGVVPTRARRTRQAARFAKTARTGADLMTFDALMWYEALSRCRVVLLPDRVHHRTINAGACAVVKSWLCQRGVAVVHPPPPNTPVRERIRPVLDAIGVVDPESGFDHRVRNVATVEA